MKARVGFLPFFGSYIVLVGETLVFRTKDKQEAIKKAEELNAKNSVRS